MFDPTAVRSKPAIVEDRNGMYTFRGAYDGPVEFFRGQLIEASEIWTSDLDVTEARDVDESIASEDVIESWNPRAQPRELDAPEGRGGNS